jgi:phycocyanobilin lyase subunit beta
MSIDAKTQKLIDKIEIADSANSLVDAVRDLADNATIAATETLIKVLAYNNPGAAVAAVDGLIAIGEPAVQPLLQELDDYNYGARAWAIRALGGIGDPRALEILLEAAAEDFALSVRRGAARGLGIITWQKMAPEAVLEAQARALDTLIQVCQDPEWVVRYAAISGLQALGVALKLFQPDLLPKLANILTKMASEESEVAVKARSQYAIQQLQMS